MSDDPVFQGYDMGAPEGDVSTRVLVTDDNGGLRIVEHPSPNMVRVPRTEEMRLWYEDADGEIRELAAAFLDSELGAHLLRLQECKVKVSLRYNPCCEQDFNPWELFETTEEEKSPTAEDDDVRTT